MAGDPEPNDPEPKMGVQDYWCALPIARLFLNTMRPAIIRPTFEHAGKVRRMADDRW